MVTVSLRSTGPSALASPRTNWVATPTGDCAKAADGKLMERERRAVVHRIVNSLRQMTGLRPGPAGQGPIAPPFYPPGFRGAIPSAALEGLLERLDELAEVGQLRAGHAVDGDGGR